MNVTKGKGQRERQKCFPRRPFYKKFKGIKIIDNITVDRYSNNKAGDLEKVYQAVRDKEKRSKELLVQFEADYPEVTNTENADTILEALKRRKARSEE